MPSLDHFGVIAPWYDKFILFKDQDEIREWANLPIDGSILDIGGGTGRISKTLIGLVDDIEIVDPSSRMLKFAKQKGVNAVCAVGEYLPYANNIFARVLIVDALHHFGNQKDVIQEAFRVLRPNGVLIVIEPNFELVSGMMIALFEKMLMMRSNFLSDKKIYILLSELFAAIQIKHKKRNSWFLATKN
jgi:ubiquinone/menaquinone biosynthesis C-methylase UbiE